MTGEAFRWAHLLRLLVLASLAVAFVPVLAAAEPHSSTSCENVAPGNPALPADATAALGPPNPNGPTQAGVGFHVLELREIDPVAGTYLFRGYLRTSWCDPRLAFDRVAAGVDERIFIGDAAEERMAEGLWTPSGFPVNRAGELTFTERILRIRHDGTIEQDVNVNVRLGGHFDLHRFPLDTQTLELQIESFVHPARRVVMVDDAARTGFDPALELPEWEIVSVKGSSSEVSVMRSREKFSRYTLEIEIARNPGFYVWKVFLPLVIIVALSWSIFWMPDERFAQRSRITSTGVLTIVAYQLAFGADLPRIGYLTLMDKAMILSFTLLAITMVESLLVSSWQQSDMERALRTDRASRMVFPAVYTLGLILILLSGG